MNNYLDYLIIIVYLVFIVLLGIFSGKNNNSLSDYFSSKDKIPWWTVCLSIVAAETSSLTFISIPGLAYIANMNFLQVSIGYLLGRIVIAKFLLPSYFDYEVKTAYSFLEYKFGKRLRKFMSLVFIFTRIAADGVRLFATAIPIKLLLGISYEYAIFIIAIIALLYSFRGGIKSVIWVDTIQWFVYLIGAIISIIFLNELILNHDPSFRLLEVFTSTKSSIFNFAIFNDTFSIFSKPYTFFASIIGGAFLSMASHGTDHFIVQRLLTVKNIKKAQLALIGSGVVVILQFLVFLFIGVLLYYNYGELSIKADEIFPKFIIEELPDGISGLLVAGIIAAAISSLAASINSLSSSTTFDLLPHKFFKLTKSKQLFLSRILILLWTGILICTANLFISTPNSVVEIALSIASFTYGGMLGIFIIGLIDLNISEEIAILGFFLSVIVMGLTIYSGIFWTWYTIIGTTVFLISSYSAYFIKKFIGRKFK